MRLVCDRWTTPETGRMLNLGISTEQSKNGIIRMCVGSTPIISTIVCEYNSFNNSQRR